jgi:hypothetical protein
MHVKAQVFKIVTQENTVSRQLHEVLKINRNNIEIKDEKLR